MKPGVLFTENNPAYEQSFQSICQLKWGSPQRWQDKPLMKITLEYQFRDIVRSGGGVEMEVAKEILKIPGGL